MDSNNIKLPPPTNSYRQSHRYKMLSEIVRGSYVIHDEHWYINVIHMMFRLIIATSALLPTGSRSSAS